ncbi:hypothetical protein HOV23_gp066 [Pseudomonas phage Lana]|uniref:Uncharacterized protein n=1 Tax=Pseudomonas phage Lana TaxID=2530172 RepID=A0A481W6K4_9CAUD|nr:hypothetical protein HOV23_gp066 [Pseudomonas phage Lana]QBJ04507.1 hypothetical protein [Pseudomonas phage Lana]
MIFKGQVLTEAQLAILMKLPPETFSLSAKNLNKAIDIALRNGGLPVPDIEVGQVVSWSIGLEQDKGRVVMYDERADKYRVTSKLKKRDVTVAGRFIRTLPVKEAADVTAE